MSYTYRNQRGFSLAETMVGLTVGLIVAAAALGTVSFMEAQKRTAVGSNSALVNGALGLLRVENETKLAGLGLMARREFACPSLNLSYKNSVKRNGDALYPAEIVDGNAGSDTLNIAYLDSLTGAAYSQVLLPMTSATAAIKLSNSPEAAVGSLLLLQDITSSKPCTIREISGVTVTAFGIDVAHTGRDYNSDAYTTAVAYAENSRASISRSIVWTTFRVRNNTLEEVNNITGETMVIADGVISLQAEYGTTDGSGTTITNWTPATGTYAAPTAANMLLVRALRVGVLARSLEPDVACNTTVSSIVLWEDGPTVDVSGDAQWACYKYRTFNMVIPLVNVVMGTR